MFTRKTSANVSTTLDEHHVEERGSPFERLSMFKTFIWDQRSPLIIDNHQSSLNAPLLARYQRFRTMTNVLS